MSTTNNPTNDSADGSNINTADTVANNPTNDSNLDRSHAIFRDLWYTEGPSQGRDQDCPICLEEMTTEDKILTHDNGTCMRSCHADCLHELMKSQCSAIEDAADAMNIILSCPNCRQPYRYKKTGARLSMIFHPAILLKQRTVQLAEYVFTELNKFAYKLTNEQIRSGEITFDQMVEVRSGAMRTFMRMFLAARFVLLQDLIAGQLTVREAVEGYDHVADTCYDFIIKEFRDNCASEFNIVCSDLPDAFSLFCAPP